MSFFNLRRYIPVARGAMGVAKRLTDFWKFTRKHQELTLDVYARLVKIAEKRGVTVPETKIKMYAE